MKLIMVVLPNRLNVLVMNPIVINQITASPTVPLEFLTAFTDIRKYSQMI